ncbi:MAG: reactive intermediate/imine deaminase [Bacteroidetes bacterium]|nr:reactive intermediate/imine deaminase [Bacteroidota bacterium]
MIEHIQTSNAPAPIGPYSQAVHTGTLLFCSGQIALDPATGQMVTSSIEEETRLVLRNLVAVLEAGGASAASVVKTTIFLTNMADFPAVNALYEEVFGASKPARSTIAVAALPKAGRIEIEAIAVVRS